MIQFIDIRALRPSTRAFVVIGVVLILAAAWLTTTAGLAVPQVLLGGTTHEPTVIPLQFYALIVVLMTCGWAYLIAGSLAASKLLRLPILVVATLIFLASTALDLGGLRGRGFVLELAGIVVLLGVVWAAALVGVRGSRTVPEWAAIAALVAFGAYFALAALAAGAIGPVPGEFEGPLAGLAAPVFVTLFVVSFVVSIPMYLLAGYEASHLLHGSAETVAESGRRVIRTDGPWMAVAAAAIALVTEWVMKPAAYRDVRVLPYSLVWVTVSVAFLELASRRVAPRHEAHSGAMLGLAIAAAAIAALVRLPQAVNVALAIVGVVLVVVSATWLLRRSSGPAGVAVLFGLIGIWGVFLNAPQILVPETRSHDFLGIVDPLIAAGLGCAAVAIAGLRSPTIAALRGPVVVTTLALVGIRIYYATMLETKASEILPTVELAILLVLGLWAMRSLPAALRVAIGLAIVGGLGASIVAGAGGGNGARIAQGLLLSIALLWEYASGGAFANHEGRRWPRESRVLMHLGYTLTALASVLFFTQVRGFEAEFEPSTVATIGLVAFGLPYVLYLGYLAARVAERHGAHHAETEAPHGDLRAAAAPSPRAIGAAAGAAVILVGVALATFASMAGQAPATVEHKAAETVPEATATASPKAEELLHLWPESDERTFVELLASGMTPGLDAQASAVCITNRIEKAFPSVAAYQQAVASKEITPQMNDSFINGCLIKKR